MSDPLRQRTTRPGRPTRGGRVALTVLALLLAFTTARAQPETLPDSTSTRRQSPGWYVYLGEVGASALGGVVGIGVVGGAIALAIWPRDPYAGGFAEANAFAYAALGGAVIGYPLGSATGTVLAAKVADHLGNPAPVYVAAFGVNLVACACLIAQRPDASTLGAAAALSLPVITVAINHISWRRKVTALGARLSGPSLALRGTPLPDGRACRSLDLRLLTLGI